MKFSSNALVIYVRLCFMESGFFNRLISCYITDTLCIQSLQYCDVKCFWDNPVEMNSHQSIHCLTSHWHPQWNKTENSPPKTLGINRHPIIFYAFPYQIYYNKADNINNEIHASLFSLLQSILRCSDYENHRHSLIMDSTSAQVRYSFIQWVFNESWPWTSYCTL